MKELFLSTYSKNQLTKEIISVLVSWLEIENYVFEENNQWGSNFRTPVANKIIEGDVSLNPVILELIERFRNNGENTLAISKGEITGSFARFIYKLEEICDSFAKRKYFKCSGFIISDFERFLEHEAPNLYISYQECNKTKEWISTVFSKCVSFTFDYRYLEHIKLKNMLLAFSEKNHTGLNYCNTPFSAKKIAGKSDISIDDYLAIKTALVGPDQENWSDSTLLNQFKLIDNDGKPIVLTIKGLMDNKEFYSEHHPLLKPLIHMYEWVLKIGTTLGFLPHVSAVGSGNLYMLYSLLNKDKKNIMLRGFIEYSWEYPTGLYVYDTSLCKIKGNTTLDVDISFIETLGIGTVY